MSRLGVARVAHAAEAEVDHARAVVDRPADRRRPRPRARRAVGAHDLRDQQLRRERDPGDAARRCSASRRSARRRTCRDPAGRCRALPPTKLREPAIREANRGACRRSRSRSPRRAARRAPAARARSRTRGPARGTTAWARAGRSGRTQPGVTCRAARRTTPSSARRPARNARRRRAREVPRASARHACPSSAGSQRRRRRARRPAGRRPRSGPRPPGPGEQRRGCRGENEPSHPETTWSAGEKPATRPCPGATRARYMPGVRSSARLERAGRIDRRGRGGTPARPVEPLDVDARSRDHRTDETAKRRRDGGGRQPDPRRDGDADRTRRRASPARRAGTRSRRAA